MCVHALACVGTGGGGTGEGEREGRRREEGESCTVLQALNVEHLATVLPITCVQTIGVLHMHEVRTFSTQYEPYPLAVYVLYTISHIICMLCNMNNHKNL